MATFLGDIKYLREKLGCNGTVVGVVQYCEALFELGSSPALPLRATACVEVGCCILFALVGWTVGKLVPFRCGQETVRCLEMFETLGLDPAGPFESNKASALAQLEAESLRGCLTIMCGTQEQEPPTKRARTSEGDGTIAPTDAPRPSRGAPPDAEAAHDDDDGDGNGDGDDDDDDNSDDDANVDSGAGDEVDAGVGGPGSAASGSENAGTLKFRSEEVRLIMYGNQPCPVEVPTVSDDPSVPKEWRQYADSVRVGYRGPSAWHQKFSLGFERATFKAKEPGKEKGKAGPDPDVYAVCALCTGKKHRTGGSSAKGGLSLFNFEKHFESNGHLKRAAEWLTRYRS